MTDIAELAARLERIETELTLYRLARQYCIGADHRDIDLWRDVWTPDAVWATGPDRVFTGVDAICAAVREQWRAFPIMQHGTVNHLVDIADGTATGRSDVIVHVRIDDSWITGGGTYLDQYRREDGRWRIASRTVTRPFDLGPIPDWQQPAD